MRNLLLIAGFMAISTICENWGDSFFFSQWNEYRHPRCIEVVKTFATKKELVDHLRSQDPRMFPHDRAYEVKPLEYDLEVKTEERKRTQEITETVETKREINFK